LIQRQVPDAGDHGRRHELGTQQAVGLARNRQQDRDDQRGDEQRKRLRRAVS
jgi:hypothetical protein